LAKQKYKPNDCNVVRNLHFGTCSK